MKKQTENIIGWLNLSPVRTGLALLAVLFVSSVVPVFSQSKNINVNLQNATIRQVFDAVEKQSDYIFYYTDKNAVNSRVSVKAEGASIDEVLGQILPRGGYKVNGRQVAVTSFNASSQSGGQQRAQMPMNDLTGRILDDAGRPVIGATVVLNGTTFGTTTDMNGNYIIRLPAGLVPESKITFSYIGKRPQTVEYQGRKNINIVLKEDPNQIEKVVVTGVANIQRRDMVGAFDQLSMDSIYNGALTSVDEMLMGQVAGLQVTMSSTRAGSAPQMTLRGQSTLLGTTSPLWVVDGVVQSDIPAVSGAQDKWTDSGSDMVINEFVGSAISWLNPQDIETVTVLKDASATAIYGSRASNGVIVVTTKKGRADSFSVNFSSTVTVGERARYSDYELMNSQQRIDFSREAFDAGVYYFNIPNKQQYTYEGLYQMFLAGEITEDQFKSKYRYLETTNTDWLKMLLRANVTQNYNLSMMGGTKRSSYAASMSYSKDDAPEKGNDKERMTARVSIGTRLSDKIRVDMTMLGTMSTTNGFAGGVNPRDYALTTSRAIPAYNEDGSPAYYMRRENYRYNYNTQNTGLPYNIVNDRNSTGSRIKEPMFSGSLNLKYAITPELSYEFVGGFSSTTRKTEQWLDETSYSIMKNYRGYMLDTPEAMNEDYRKAALLARGGTLVTDDVLSKSYSVQNKITFSKTFNEDHRMNLFAMYEISSARSNAKYNTVWGYDRARGESINRPTPTADFVPILNAGSSPADIYSETLLRLYSSFWKSTRRVDNKMSVAAFGTYSFKNRYLINANFRNDWSNFFGQDANKRFVPAYSVGVQWKIAAESFMAGTEKWLDVANIRVTYGTQGNELASTPNMILDAKGVHQLYGDYYSNISKLATPNLSWERTKQWDGGIDLGLFDGRVTLVVDAYSRKSDVGRQLKLPVEYGGYGTTLTGAMIRNSGLEGTLNVVAYRNKDWNVSVGVNVGRNWNKVLSTTQKDTDQVDYSTYLKGSDKKILEVGYGLGSFWCYSFAGLDPNTGLPTFNNMTGHGYSAPYTDYLVYAGSKQHDLSGGFNLRVRYKQFMLSTNFSANIGGKAFLPNPYKNFDYGRLPEVTSNLSKELLKRWKTPGDVTDIPGLYRNITTAELYIRDPHSVKGDNPGTDVNIYDMWGSSDNRVVSTSVLRCNTLSFTYVFDNKVIGGIGLKRLALTAGVSNLFLITNKKWNGMDPDMGGTQRAPRGYSFGVSVGF